MSKIEPFGSPPIKNLTLRQVIVFGSLWLAIIIGSLVLFQWLGSEDLSYATADEMLAALTKPDATIRRDAFYRQPFLLVAGGSPANEKVIPVLLDIVANDPDEEVALLAVNSLNMLNDPPIAAIVKMIAADNAKERSRAEDALIVLATEHDQVVEELIALIKTNLINDSIVKVLFSRGETAAAVPAVLDLIKDPATVGKETTDAASALLFHAGEAARPAYEDLATHDLPDIRAIGKRGLHRLTDNPE